MSKLTRGICVISSSLDKAKEVGSEVVQNRTVRMLGRNTVASLATFALDLTILWVLVEFVGIPAVPAAAMSFILPLIVFYFLQREWVFPDTNRSVAKGFVYFLLTVGIGFAAMLTTFWALLEFTSIHYLIARVVASIVYGLLLFVLNGVFNFKQL